MSEKFILVSLEEKKSKELAEVLSNKTSRKILDYLSENEGSSSEISKELGIALSTVEYNLKNLVKAGLVDVEEFKWSPKGRAMDIYKVKKKYIVMAPGETSELREAFKRVLPIGLFGAIVAGFMEFFSRPSVLKVPLKKETITKTITEGRQMVDFGMEKAVGGAAEGVAAAPMVGDKFVEPVINVSTQVSESVKEVVLPNPHYGLWFFIGLIVVLGIYLLFSLRKNR